ncbi:N-acetyltransferase [uncultured Anaerovibrio sp.]|uniref:N-acetyltransferase n=1 Tax=uncultured Anaerovibrio sp. TaxID=361586 RepID=UPI0025DEB708|nr:N-acetyltransferase [uncultured Anaerovibrio sp.]
MLGFIKINLRDMSEKMDLEQIKTILSDFYCPYNKDVDEFIQFKALEFSKQHLASTYLVFASCQKKPVLVGYFALASKYFHIDARTKNRIGSNLRKRISKFADYDAFLQRYIVPAPLIGQLGKNYKNGYDKLITGDELLQIACDTVKEGQRILGGKLVYLECEDVPSLIRFYEENGFCSFGKRELDGDERDKMKGQYLIQMLKYLGE